MATVHIAIGRVLPGGRGAVAGLPADVLADKQTIASSGASQASSIVVPATDVGTYFWSVTADGGDVWVKFGAAPVAAAGADWLIKDGDTREFGATAGNKCAVIDQ